MERTYDLLKGFERESFDYIRPGLPNMELIKHRAFATDFRRDCDRDVHLIYFPVISYFSLAIHSLLGIVQRLQ